MDAQNEKTTKDEGSLSIEERRARRRKRKRSDSTNESASASESSSSGNTEGKGTRTRTREEALKAREREKMAAGENLPIIGGLVAYLRGVASEIRKVTWPTQEEARRLTIIVLIVSALFAIFLGVIDYFYGIWFQTGIEDSATTFILIGIPFFAIGGFISWKYILSIET